MGTASKRWAWRISGSGTETVFRAGILPRYYIVSTAIHHHHHHYHQHHHQPIFMIIIIITTTISFSISFPSPFKPTHPHTQLFYSSTTISPHTARTRVYKPPSSLAGFCFLSSHFHTGLYYTAVWCGVGWGLKSNILEFNVFGGVYGWGFGGVGGIKKRNKKDSWGGRGGERAGGGLKTRGTSADVWVGLVGFSPI